MEKNEFIGRLYVNKTKDGRSYLRGKIDGKAVVGFFSDKTESYGIKLDERPAAESKEGGAPAKPTYAAKPTYTKKPGGDHAPF
jgi:hypothetical protein